MRHIVSAALIALALAFAAPSTSLVVVSAQAQANLIDINSASKADLEKLKGIGPVRADAIIKGRPYKGKDELVQKKIISKSVYDGIKDLIIARQK